MQTISLEEEIKLTDGILYHINFDQNFSAMCIDGCPIENIPTGDIIESIINPKSENVAYAAYDDTPSWKSYWRIQKIWKAADKFAENELKIEKDWKKDSKKRRKRAIHYLEKVEKW